MKLHEFRAPAMPSPAQWAVAAWVVMAAGFVLRARDFLHARSLWLDEARLGINFLERDLGQLLTQPMEYDQVGPAGYFVVVESITTMLGTTDLMLRLFPLLAGMLLPVFVYLAAREVMGNSFPTVFSTCLAAFGQFALRYSNEGKPYMVDCAVAALLLWLSLRVLAGKRHGWIPLAIFGTVAPWLSYPSIFMLAGAGIVLFAREVHQRQWPDAVRLVVSGGMWLGSFGLHFVLFASRSFEKTVEIINEPGKHWESGWMPFPPTSVGELLWFPSNWSALLEMSLSLGLWHRAPMLPVAAIAALTVFCGLLLFAKKHGMALAIVLVPYAFALIASAPQIYPVHSRAAFFLTPGFILAAGFAVHALLATKTRLAMLAVGILFATSLLPTSAYAVKNFLFPFEYQELKRVLDRLEPRIEPNQQFFIYYGAVPQFRFYDRYFNQPESSTVFGSEFRVEPERYIEEIVEVIDQPEAWIVFSHTWEGDSGNERDFIVDELSRQWELVDKIEDKDAHAYLFRTGIEK